MRRLYLLAFLVLFVGLGTATAVYAVSLSGGNEVRSAAAETDLYESLESHPFTMDPINFGCPPSEHVYWYANYRNCDPVNLVFEDLNLVEVVLALQARGWTAFGLGAIQYIHLANENVPVVQSAQLFLRYDGGSGPCAADVRMCRYHVRLWAAPSGQGIIGAVHFEDGTLLNHELRESWEYAEQKVCDDFDALPRFRCRADAVRIEEQESIQRGATWRANAGFSGTNDKRASLIEREVGILR